MESEGKNPINHDAPHLHAHAASTPSTPRINIIDFYEYLRASLHFFP